jgi:cell division protease FtsH
MSNPPEKPSGRGPLPPQLPNRLGRSLMSWAFVITAMLLVMFFLWRTADARRPLTPQEFWTYAENGNLRGTLVIADKQIDGELSEQTPGMKSGDPKKFTVQYPYATTDRSFDERLQKALARGSARGGTTAYRYDTPGWWEGWLVHLILMVALFMGVWFFLFRRLGAATNGGGFLGSFGRSRHRVLSKEMTKITFQDVAGIQEAKEEVAEIIEFLRNPRKFQRLGGRIPRGVLLVGEPGCGKTLLAKAIAGEADVPFFSISGSDFVEMFVGVGASRVRDLFKQAKDSAPCIIFLDEIDAVGRRRGVGFNSGGHDEREQTLNAILVEMDGFDTSDQVIVIAATNRMDVLDPALTRPGRFDRQINVPLPDVKGRFEILQIYAAKIKGGPDVDLHRLARGTPMFSGADLEAMVNEAAIAATMAEKEFVEQADLEEARDKVRWGRARKSRAIDEKENENTAYHEAGHAFVQIMLPDADPLHKVSIIPRGSMLGATFALPEKDRHTFSRRYLKAELALCFGGQLAEDIFCHDISSGAQADIAQATAIARKMILDWGMSARLGPINFNSEERPGVPIEFGTKPYSDKTSELIDEEVRALIDEGCQTARKILESNQDIMHRLAAALMKYETLSAEEVRQIVDGKTLDKPTVGDLLDRERARSAEPGLAAPPTLTPFVPPVAPEGA